MFLELLSGDSSVDRDTVCNVRQNDRVESMSQFPDAISMFLEPVNLRCYLSAFQL